MAAKLARIHFPSIVVLGVCIKTRFQQCNESLQLDRNIFTILGTIVERNSWLPLLLKFIIIKGESFSNMYV